MKNIFSVFSELYPLQDEPKLQLKHNSLIGVFVALFLFIFKPFGISGLQLPFSELIFVFAGYGLITFLVALFCDRVIKVAFPQFFDEQLWTVGKQIIWVTFVIMLIGIGNLFYSNLLGFSGISGTSFLYFQFYTFVIAVFPVMLLTLINRMRLLKHNLKTVKSINHSLEAPLSAPPEQMILSFSSDNGKDELRLSCDQFLFAESADNYTDVVYVENGIVKRALIRSTLKRLETLNSTPCIVRPHRAYLVNLSKVTKVAGSSQGYRLLFGETEDTIPVARRNASEVRELLTALHKVAG
ncbi:MAG TPA: LytTR family transcriptional regulator DNA-binding domain-containing protein [Bacteroidia bacterium]|nr:LytTR family transcriptional regulator DNA-binding domain-containing protein [Bacteroidia bacterium]